MKTVRGTLFILWDKVLELFKDGKPYRSWYDKRMVDMAEPGDHTVEAVFTKNSWIPFDEYFHEKKIQLTTNEYRHLYMGEWIPPEDDGS